MCSFCSVKCCFIFFNMVFMASGVALIIIGAQQHSTYTQMGAFAGNSLSKIAIVLMAVGATITLVSILGFLGAFFNNYSMVSCFICILIIIILLEILTGALFYVFRSRVRHLNPQVKVKTLAVLLRAYKKEFVITVKSAIDYENKARRVITEYSPEKRNAIDRIQEKFRCCGADGPTDWSSSVGWENHDAMPDSCCVVKSQGCGQDKDKVNTKGCIQAMRLFLLKNLVWVGAVCIALGIAEGFGVIVGVFFCLNIKGKSYESMG